MLQLTLRLVAFNFFERELKKIFFIFAVRSHFKLTWKLKRFHSFSGKAETLSGKRAESLKFPSQARAPWRYFPPPPVYAIVDENIDLSFNLYYNISSYPGPDACRRSHVIVVSSFYEFPQFFHSSVFLLCLYFTSG